MPWIALGGLLLAAGIRLAGLAAPFAGLLPGCAFKRITGLACATCGLTRCVLALGRGQWREAAHWHPAAVLLLVLLVPAALWDLGRAWRGRPYPPLPSHRAVRWGAWVFLGAAWALQVARGL